MIIEEEGLSYISASVLHHLVVINNQPELNEEHVFKCPDYDR